MSHISKIDLHLTQLILKTSNVKNNKKEVLVGGFKENITYENNNPLGINVYNDKGEFFLNSIFDSISEFDISYIHRVQGTPFFVSYLCNNDIAIKILDFYDWRTNNTIYRLFVIKNVNFKSTSEHLNINLNFDSELKIISETRVEINKVILEISEKYKINKNALTCQLSISSDPVYFGININFDTKNISSLTLDNIVKKFYELESICLKQHILNYFVTKNQKSENELDELWNQQKFILPDFSIDKKLTGNDKTLEIEKYWISDFCNYFNIKNELKYDITKLNKKSHGLTEDIPSKYTILSSRIVPDIKSEDIANDIQKWWDLYSFPLLGLIFKNKCLREPEEVYAVYFLAIRLHLPWAPIIYKKIISFLEDERLSQLHHFLLLLTYCYKRIIKTTLENGNNYYIPGYMWDNNYKSINKEFDLSKFSKNVYLKLNIKGNNYFKINKLCEIQFEGKDKKINIFPALNKSLTGLKIHNILNIKIDEFKLVLPLIWENGYFEFKNIRFKWLLKKNRLQITLQCKEEKLIYINRKKIKLSTHKKTIHYIKIQQVNPALYIGLYNKNGCKNFSINKIQQDPILVSGFAFTKYGMVTNKILYSSDQRKHQLFNIKDIYSNTGVIQLRKVVDQLNFYAKFITSSVEIPYMKNEFIKRFLNLNIFDWAKLLLIIDGEFKSNLIDIFKFFKNNFRLQPEFVIKDKKSNLQSRSNLIIEFQFEKKLFDTEGYEFRNKNKLIIKGNNYKALLEILEKLVKNNKK